MAARRVTEWGDHISALGYDGPDPASGDITNQKYVNTLAARNISQDQVNTLISEGLSLFATKTYVDAQDAQNATEAYIDQQDALRLGLNKVNVNNGVPGLDSKGKVEKARVNIPSTQQYPMAYWSPTTYNAGTVTATSESTVYTMTVADPGFPYRLMVTGTVDTTISIDGEWPVIRVREDSIAGTIVAIGRGSPESYDHSTAIIVPYFGGVPSTPPAFDAVGAGFTGYGVAPSKYYGGITSFSSSHVCAANSYLIVDATALGGHVMSYCNYRGSPMTLLATVPLNNNPSSGSLYRYGMKIDTAGGGNVTGSLSANAWLSMQSISYTHVQDVGPSTSIYGFGTNTSISQEVTVPPGQIALQSFGADGTTPKWTASGGIERVSMGYPSGGDSIDLLSVSESSVSTTFRMDATYISNCAGISTNLLGVAGSYPQNSKTGPTTLYVTVARSGEHATATATNIEPNLSVMAIPA